MYYFDHAATTLRKPPEVTEAVVQALQQNGNSGRGAGESALRAGRTIYAARSAVARLIGAGDPERIVFTMNSTQALNTAIKGTLQPGDHVITTELEHNSVLRPLYEMEQMGVHLSVIPADEFGRISYEQLAVSIRRETRVIVCTHASNLTGNVLDLRRIGAIARAHNLLFIVDASQTAGVIPINVEAMGIDILCFTGHKSLMGPQGTGGMYVRPGVRVKPLVSGGTGIHSFEKEQPADMPTHLEAGTMNSHGLAGLRASVEWILDKGTDRILVHELELMQAFYHGVRQIPGIRIYGDMDQTVRCPVIALNLGDMDSAELADWLEQEYGIVTRPGAHCAPLMHQRFGTVRQGAVRFSFGWYNTEEEINYAIHALQAIAREQI